MLMQVHGPELPAPLGQLSPWLDFLGEELDAVLSRLAAQAHRRVIKTHSPLDGIPLTGAVHYVVVARHPLDAAVSLWHQSANITRARTAELTGREEATGTRPEATDWLRRWIAADRAAYRDRAQKLVGDAEPGFLAWLHGEKA